MVASVQLNELPDWPTTPGITQVTVPVMLDRIGRKSARQRTFKLKAWLGHFELSFERFGGRMGTSKGVVSKWASGKVKNPPVEAIAAVLEIPWTKLYEDPPPKGQKPKQSIDELIEKMPEDRRDETRETVIRIIKLAS